jgi:hypothetical protein
MDATTIAAPPPAHLPKFQNWAVSQDGKAVGTAGIYSRQLSRCARFYGIQINERSVRTEADVQRIIDAVTKVVLRRGRWAKGTLNIYDVRRNLVFALQAYSRFAQAVFPTVASARSRKRKATESIGSRATARKAKASSLRIDEIAIDVATDELPKRMKSEVSRLIRNTRLVQAIKQAHANSCQLCGQKLELMPGTFYSEGHHLKPVGQPHNGPDTKDNILCVCPNCHVKLDFAVINLDATKLKTVPGHSVRPEFVDYHNSLCKAVVTQQH